MATIYLWYDRLLYDMEKSGLYLYAADYSEDKDTVTLEIGNKGSIIGMLFQTLSLADMYLPERYKSIHNYVRMVIECRQLRH